MALLRHLPTNRILYVLTLAMRIFMLPPERMERALTSLGVNPTCGPVILTAARSDFLILVLQTNVHLFLWKILAKYVLLVVQCHRRYAKRHKMDTTAHALGCPVVPWPIELPLTLFFWSMKRRLLKVAVAQAWGGAVVAGVGRFPMNNWMYQSWRDFDTVSFMLF